jgi:mono/diheme cytochrome c family protein
MKKTLMIAALAAFTFAPAASAAEKKIERLWKSKCSSCHGMDGKGQTEKGKKMKVQDLTSAEYKGKEADVRKAIEDGVKKETGGVKQEMDGYKADLKTEDLDGLIKMSLEFKK